MFTILFDIFLLLAVKKASPKAKPTRTGNDVFIPFGDGGKTNNNQYPPAEDKTDYFPGDFDDYGDGPF